MIDVFVAPEFVEQYQKLPAKIRKKVKRQELFFRASPTHPSLHTEKLQPKEKGLWSFRIDRHYRVIFRFLNEGTAFFLSIGTHQGIYRKLS